MTTHEFNKTRSEKWVKRFTDDESRLFLMVGVKQNRSYTFLMDESQTKEKIAQKLEELAKAVRMDNSSNS
jgi:hypothetical protein